MATETGMISEVERTLAGLLEEARPAVLFEAMRHAVMAGGKRIRPQICLASAVAAGGRMEDALFPACAIELLHSYTLVHDDLPAMDNDTMRRGQPSVWAKYGEADAILAGDALQALAFRTAAQTPRNVDKVLAELGEAAVGVVRGQVEDVARQRLTTNDQRLTTNDDFIYRHKTADLFIAAAAMGALAGGGSNEDVARLRAYALNLGMAFQHTDDLQDGDSPYPVEETRQKVVCLTAAAIAALDGLPGDTAPLAVLAERIVATYHPSAKCDIIKASFSLTTKRKAEDGYQG